MYRRTRKKRSNKYGGSQTPSEYGEDILIGFNYEEEVRAIEEEYKQFEATQTIPLDAMYLINTRVY